ncbi:MAG: VanZ family protein [Bacteroidales bacterium]|nr:VanZ family protein [Bacteroidales bacterium]MBN2748277.1 VanZ family protein [Bacteroidales bacterium]
MRINWYRFLFWIWFVTVLIVSSLSCAGIQSINLGHNALRIDYPMHSIAYALFPVFAFISSDFGKKRLRFALLFTLSVALAVATEYIQLMVPKRSFNPKDMAFNLMGLAIGAIAVIIVHHSLQRKRQRKQPPNS